MRRLSFVALALTLVSPAGAFAQTEGVQTVNPYVDAEAEAEEEAAEPAETEAEPAEAASEDTQTGETGETAVVADTAANETLAPPPPAEPTPCGASAHGRAAQAVVRVRSGGQWGAGYLYRDNRTVITAFSLLALGRPTRVVTQGGTSIDASLIARDETADLAILRLDEPMEGTALEPAPETSARLGADVVAIGHHFVNATFRLGDRAEGLLRWSVTQGRVGGQNGYALQADMAVSAGNAGGPLLDCRGRVLGTFAGSGLLSADLGIVTRIGRADELLASPDGEDFLGNLRPRLGVGGALHIDEEGQTAAGFYLILGATLFDRVSWMNRVGFFFGGIDDPVGAELSNDRQMVRVESLLGWRFFVDLFGLTTLYIVPAAGLSVTYETLSSRSAAVTPMCTPSDTDSCIGFTESSTDQWLVRPAVGLTFLPGGNFEIGYVLELGFDTDPVETYHQVRLGLQF
ncbi:MAG: serine protease [Sandaracinaceae bacterium]